MHTVAALQTKLRSWCRPGLVQSEPVGECRTANRLARRWWPIRDSMSVASSSWQTKLCARTRMSQTGQKHATPMNARSSTRAFWTIHSRFRGKSPPESVTLRVYAQLFIRPKVPMNVQNAFLSRTISLLDGLAEIRHSRELSRLRVKKEAHAARISAMVAENAAHASSHTMLVDSQPEGAVPTAESSGEQDKDQETETSDGSPLHYMTIGTNAVTKKLETLSNRHRKALFPTESSADVSGKAPNPQLVLVCSADVNPPILISHIPSLIAACNTTRPRSDASAQTSVCWLVPLPLGSEAQLSQAIGLKRVSVIAIDVSDMYLERGN